LLAEHDKNLTLLDNLLLGIDGRSATAHASIWRVRRWGCSQPKLEWWNLHLVLPLAKVLQGVGVTAEVGQFGVMECGIRNMMKAALRPRRWTLDLVTFHMPPTLSWLE